MIAFIRLSALKSSGGVARAACRVLTTALVLVCGAGAALAVRATEPSPQSTLPVGPRTIDELRWEDLLGVLEDYPALLAAGKGTEAAAAAISTARAYPNPEIELSVGRAEENEGDARAEIRSVGLSLPLIWPGLRGSEAAAAGAEHETAVHIHQEARDALWLELRHLFWRLAYHDRRLQALEQSREQVRKLVAAGSARVESGDARPLELKRLEVELIRADLAVEQARAEARADRETLRRRFGLALSDGGRVRADLEDLRQPPALAEAVERARVLNPSLLAAEGRVKAARARWQIERQRRIPELSIGGFYAEELDAHAVGATVTFELPLWNWKGGAVRQARAAAEAARLERGTAGLELEAELAALHAQATQARAQAAAYGDDILPRAREAAVALERLYEVGEVGVFEVIDGRRTLLEAEADMVNACLEYQVAYADLNVLIGGMDDE
ncbi:MAG: TolC family protein [Candidatus Eisenbacteria bacterium]